MKEPCTPSADACGGALERPCYFPRQLITADDLTLEQEYFRERLRLHNRLLHGWGTVCGTEVCRVPDDKAQGEPDPWRVKIKPGYVIGPYGDDIYLGSEVVVDVRTAGLEGADAEPAEAAADPWCSRVCLPRDPGPLCLAIRYKECRTRPVRVQPVGCGCEGDSCEYSRCRDSYEIGFLDECPESQKGKGNLPEEFEGPIPPCPPCPTDPWVVLACLEIGDNGIVGMPDNCSCRRLVLGLAPYWWRCTGKKEPHREYELVWMGPDGNRIEAELGRNGLAHLEVHGAGIGVATKAEAGASVTVEVNKTSTADSLHAIVRVGDDAAPGSRSMRFLDEQGATVAEIADAFQVVTDMTVEELVVQWRRDGSFVAAELSEGDEVSVSVAGPMITASSKLDLGEGFEIRNMHFAANTLRADVRVIDGATLGPRSIRILDASGNLVGEKIDGVRVVPGKTEPRGRAKSKPKTKRRSGGKKKGKGGGSG